jgi:hypothetical protein
MAFHVNPNWMSVLCIVGIQIFVLCFPPQAFANQKINSNPWAFLEQHRSQILELSSDEEALTFFQATTKPQVKGSRTHNNSQSSATNLNLSEETRKTITTYLASLAVAGHAQALRKSIVGPTMESPPASERIPEGARLQWLMKQSPLNSLESVMEFYKQVSAWSQTASQPFPAENDFAEFASYYDQTYPDWAEGPLSWTSIFQEQGQKGIEARLLEYWQAPDRLASQHTSSQSTHHAYAQHYIGIRLLPMFRANLLAQTIRLEATAYETARETWHHIQQWQQQEQTKAATTRLCGTWQWIVHNHQNHGDHKMTITFSPPEHSSSSQLEPTTIAIQGDTVFLKWTFPQGVQEDSLLLSNHDTRLEGTFKNSLGPHGSISGKRLSTCRS